MMREPMDIHHAHERGMTAREAKRHLHLEGKKYPEDTMVRLPEEMVQAAGGQPHGLRQVWRSRYFIAQVFEEPGGVWRISVSRAMIGDDGRWLDGITWEELQTIKGQVGFADRMAVEIFPPARDVVNVANMRHLWVLAEPLGFAWRTKV